MSPEPRVQRLAAVCLALPVLAACSGVRPADAPPPPPSEPAESRELSSPVEGEEAHTLEDETREAIRTAEALLRALDAETHRANAEPVERVRGLLDQSRSALAEGDLERAHNLARKARELAAEL